MKRILLAIVIFFLSISSVNSAYLENTRTTLVDTNEREIVVELPEYDDGDLLLFIVAKDTTNGGTFSNNESGWVKLDGSDQTQSNQVRSAVYYYVNAPAGLSNPEISSTDSDTWSSLAVNIKNYDLSTPNPINVFEHEDGSFGGNDDIFPPINTTKNNSLVLYLAATDNVAQAYFVDEGRLLSYDDGVGVSTIGMYDSKILAGQTEEKVILSSGGEQNILYVIAVDNDGGNYTPAKIQAGFNHDTLFNAFHRTEAGSYLPSASVDNLTGSIFQYLEDYVPTIEGVGVSRVEAIMDQADSSTVPYVRAMRFEADRDTNNLGMIMFLDRTLNNQSYDFSKDGSYIFLTAHTINAKVASLGAKVEDRGFGLGIMDSNNNYKIFRVGGRNAALPFSSADAGQYIIDPKSEYNIMQEAGTIDYSDIDRVIVVQNAQLANNYFRQFSGMFKGSEYNLFGGSSVFPAGFADVEDYNKRINLKTLLKTGNIINLDVAILLGKESIDTYFDASGETVIFGGNNDGRQLTNFTYGIVFNNSINDIVDFSSSTILSDNPYRLNTVNELGTIDFSQSTVTKCSVCVFRSNSNLSKSLFTPADGFSLESYGADITDITVNGELKLYVRENLNGVTTDSLYLNVSGEYVFTDTQTTNLTLNHTGNMTINLINSNQPTVNNIGGGDITFRRPVFVEILGLLGNETVRIFDQDNNVTLFNQVLTNSSFNLEVNYVSDIQLLVDVREKGKVPQSYDVTLDNDGISLSISLEDDLIYDQMGIDGDTVTGLTIQKDPLRILMNVPSDETTLQKIYTWWSAETAKPIYMDVNPQSLRALTAVEIKSFNDLKFRNDAADALTITGGNVQYDGGIASEIVDAGGSIIVVSATVVPFIDPGSESQCITDIETLSEQVNFIKNLLLIEV